MRLGRLVEHDPRSRDYPARVLPNVKPAAWVRRSPVLDQGAVGSCTGNALAGLLGTDRAEHTATAIVTVQADTRHVFTAGPALLDEAFALRAYTLNTILDSIPGAYPAKDTGSSSLACGKTGKALGLFTGYRHAFSIAAVRSALQSGPVLVGIPWLNSMFDPGEDGRLLVDPARGLAGGHELVIGAWTGTAFRLDNSWGPGWGSSGSCWVADADLAWLLGQRGDVLVPEHAVGT